MFSNNFGIQGGIIQNWNDGYFEMYRCTITNNHAYTLPIADIFIVSTASIISNSTIMSNIAFSEDQIQAEMSSCSEL